MDATGCASLIVPARCMAARLTRRPSFKNGTLDPEVVGQEVHAAILDHILGLACRSGKAEEILAYLGEPQ
jgi:hypothetical protein